MAWLEFLRSGISWSETLNNAEKGLKIAAMVVGGIWTYLKFIRGRIYRPRLKPSVSGRIAVINGQPHLVVDMSMENVGSSKANIDQRGTGLRLFSPELQPTAAPPDEIKWMRLGSFPVFDKHGWIETGERIQDELLITLPPGRSAFKLELRVCVKGIEWQAKTIIESGDGGKQITPKPI
jgi:hypothetical protein